MSGVDPKVIPELLLMAFAVAIFMSGINLIIQLFVVRMPKVPEMPDATAGEWRSETWISSGEGLINLAIPNYLRQHLMRHGITTIRQVGELCDPPAGTKAKWPYGFGPVRQKIVRDAYDAHTKAYPEMITPLIEG